MTRGEPRVGTLGSWAASHPAIRLFCEDCDRTVTLVLADLVARHGADLPLQAFLERAICSSCGSHAIELQVVAATAF